MTNAIDILWMNLLDGKGRSNDGEWREETIRRISGRIHEENVRLQPGVLAI